MGDCMMMHSTDPTTLMNGIRNYFALLGRVSTASVKDLVYLKAGESYRRLDRASEAAFCLRVAAQSRERFIATRARAELADLFDSLGDPGLSRWFSPHR